MGFDKFVWIKALIADPAVPFRGRTIGTLCAISFVTYGKDTFAVRQETIAARCGTTRKTVNLGLGDLRAAGYLVKDQRRAQGPGRHGGDQWRLVFPECCNPSVHHSGEKWCNASVQHSKSGVTETAECCNPNGQSGVTGLSECCNPPNSPISTKDPPKVLKKGLEKGLEKGSGQNPKNPSQEQEHAPGGAGQDEKKPRPQLPAMVHGLLKSTNPARAGNRPPPLKDDAVREEREPFVERIQGIAVCERCDHFGDVLEELGSDGEPVRCWHGKEPAPLTMKGTL